MLSFSPVVSWTVLILEAGLLLPLFWLVTLLLLFTLSCDPGLLLFWLVALLELLWLVALLVLFWLLTLLLLLTLNWEPGLLFWLEFELGLGSSLVLLTLSLEPDLLRALLVLLRLVALFVLFWLVLEPLLLPFGTSRVLAKVLLRLWWRKLMHYCNKLHEILLLSAFLEMHCIVNKYL